MTTTKVNIRPEQDGLIGSINGPVRASVQMDLAGRVTFATINVWAGAKSDGLSIDAGGSDAVDRVLARWLTIRERCWPELLSETEVSLMFARIVTQLRVAAEELVVLRRSRGAA